MNLRSNSTASHLLLLHNLLHSLLLLLLLLHLLHLCRRLGNCRNLPLDRSLEDAPRFSMEDTKCLPCYDCANRLRDDGELPSLQKGKQLDSYDIRIESLDSKPDYCYLNIIFRCGYATLHLAVLVKPSLRPSIRPSITFLNCEQFSHYCSCPTVRNWIAVYPALFVFFIEKKVNRKNV